MSVKLLTEHHFEFLSLKGGCTDSSESTLAKTSHCWKSHVLASRPIYALLLICSVQVVEEMIVLVNIVVPPFDQVQEKLPRI